MTQAAVKEFNNSGRSHGGSIRVPYEFMRTYKGTSLITVSAAFSFSGRQNDRAVQLKASELAERYRFSLRSAKRTIKKSLSAGMIERSRENVSKYEYKGNSKKSYLHVEEWLYHATFALRGETVYLSKNEVLVLSYLISLCREIKGTPLYKTTRNRIAKRLQLSTTTVSKAISRLTELGLITASGKALNNYVKTAFTLQLKAIDLKKKETINHTKSISRMAAESDARAERERFYDRRRQAAESRAEALLKRANSNEAFRQANDAAKALRIKVASAEVHGANDLKDMQKKLQTAEKLRSKCLTALGLTEEDLRPQYACTKCCDRGTLPNGHACDCYPGRMELP